MIFFHRRRKVKERKSKLLFQQKISLLSENQRIPSLIPGGRAGLCVHCVRACVLPSKPDGHATRRKVDLPTGPFAILEPRDQAIVVQKGIQERRATDFEAQKLKKVRSGCCSVCLLVYAYVRARNWEMDEEARERNMPLVAKATVLETRGYYFLD